MMTSKSESPHFCAATQESCGHCTAPEDELEAPAVDPGVQAWIGFVGRRKEEEQNASGGGSSRCAFTYSSDGALKFAPSIPKELVALSFSAPSLESVLSKIWKGRKGFRV